MSMGWGYVSELRSPTGLLFISQVIYEYRERRWDDTDREKRKNWRETCPSATLSAINTKWIYQGLRGQRPATIHRAMARPNYRGYIALFDLLIVRLFSEALQLQRFYTASREMRWWPRTASKRGIWKVTVVAYLKVQRQHLLWETEKNNRTWWGCPVFRQRFELGISQM
jgi:hypothetical protein